MCDSEVAKPVEGEAEPPAPVLQVFSDILKPTLHDNDFLQSFVRIGIDEPSDSRRATPVNERLFKR